jgi:uncharacterized protein
VMSRAVPPARGAVEAISATRRQRASLERVRHRPFPLPHGPWVMGQSWVDLLFAHWRLPEAALRAVVPDAVPIDSYDGSAWIGITPFRDHRRAPARPSAAALAVPVPRAQRTHVHHDRRTTRHLVLQPRRCRAAAALAARLAYRLPYRHARMAITRSEHRIQYRSQAVGARAVLRASYEPAGPVSHPADGTLEHFLTERYCLYTLTAGDACAAPTSTTRHGLSSPPEPSSPRTP